MDKTCNSPVTSSCDSGFRAKCPLSLTLVSGSCLMFLYRVYIFISFSIVIKDLKKACSHVIQYLVSQCMESIVYFPLCALQDFSRDVYWIVPLEAPTWSQSLARDPLVPVRRGGGVAGPPEAPTWARAWPGLPKLG